MATVLLKTRIFRDGKLVQTSFDDCSFVRELTNGQTYLLKLQNVDMDGLASGFTAEVPCTPRAYAIRIDQNYGGTDALQFSSAAGVGIAGAIVTAFPASDYAVGNRSSVGESITDSSGRWRAPMMLEPAQSYLLIFEARGYENASQEIST